MISFLRGAILHKGQDSVILETSNLGYQIFLAPHLLETLQKGQGAAFYTFEYTYEERHDLYGFATPQDLEFFLMLIDVPGIGPRLAQKITGGAPVEKIKKAIIEGDLQFFSSIPRVGGKTAEKIIMELRPRLTKEKKFGVGDPDLEEALKRLGYSAMEINEALAKLPSSPALPSEEKLKQALKLLKRG